jgi:hypothetical protein
MTLKNIIIVILALMLSVFFQGAAALAEDARLQIAPIAIESGQSFIVPVTISQIVNLAGIKLVLQYDSNLISYVKTEKSKKTSQLMQVVNDKKPGNLIIVMAGAKGISGKKMELFHLYFKATGGLKKEIVTIIQVVEIELVSDLLKAISCKSSEGEITILPERN